jgi:O-antigen/teichoic acid export membrane protein
MAGHEGPIPSAGRRLRPDIVSGLGWNALSQVVTLVTRSVSAVVVARLLGPDDFGLAAMALAFAALGTVLSDAALGSALVQRRDLTEADRSTAFWLSAAVGTVLALAGVAVAGAVADFFDREAVQPLFVALSCGLVVGALSGTPAALLTRAFRFRALELSRMAAGLAAAGVAIAVAAAGGGAWAIVIGHLTGMTLAGTFFWIAAGWRPHWTWSGKSMRELGGFGLDVLGSRVFFYLQRNADNLIIGRALGAAPLGAYAIAYNLILLPFARVVAPLREVLYPAFARVQDELERVAALWLRGTRAVVALFFPAMLGLAVVAPDFVAVVLGERWAAAVDPIRVLAFVGLLQAMIMLNSTALTALGHTRALLRFSVLTFVLSVAGFLIGVRHGITGVAVGYLAANLVMVPLYLRLTARAIGVSARRFAAACSGPTQAAAGMLVGVVGARAALVAAGAPAGLRLVLVAVAGAALAAVLTAWRTPDLVAELRALPRDWLGARPATPTRSSSSSPRRGRAAGKNRPVPAKGDR